MRQRLHLSDNVMLLGTLQRLEIAFSAPHAYKIVLLTVHPLCMEACWSIPFKQAESPDACIHVHPLVPQLLLWHA